MLGVKLHGARHFPFFVWYYGAPKVTDMVHFERGHKPVKVAFRGTSQREASTNLEIIRSLEVTVLRSEALQVCEEARRSTTPSTTVATTTYRSQGYITDTGIAFEAYCTKASSVRILWNRRLQHFGVPGNVEPQFLNPKVKLQMISSYFEKTMCGIMDELGETSTLRELQRNGERCKLLIVRSFKMDATTQGLPVQALVCCRSEIGKVGVRAGRQSRFDWLTIGQGTQHIRFIIVTYSLPYLTYTLFTLTCTFKLNVGDNKRDTTEQLIGLFVLVRRDRDPVFFYMSIKTKVVSMGTNSVVPLPQCKSSLTYTLLSNIYTFTNHTYVFSTVQW